MYALRVCVWIRSKVHSRVKGGWVGKGQSVHTYSTNMARYTRPTHQPIYNCMSLFIVFALEENSVFTCMIILIKFLAVQN